MIEVLGVVLVKAYQIHGVYLRLKSFVDTEMADFVGKLGDTHFDAAQRHLANAERNPARRHDYVLLAVGDLENAYRDFINSAPKGFTKFVLEFEFFGHGSGYKRRAKAYDRACAAAVLQSICYTYLDDAKSAGDSIAIAITCFEEYAEAAEQVFWDTHHTAYFGTPGVTSTRVIGPEKDDSRNSRQSSMSAAHN